ncbi:hypothetical protein QTN47_03490 [Danxiaibacter flavus]|uniref:HYR-like domain-containing protein n=1 Tax=Danxiaibacter flavus TaxID=3049108 RepID=A0ABV3ZAB7_9BACT|nr:hypothetical protein QNM32_03490 [Chitinophagaceae bacterium DXS]
MFTPHKRKIHIPFLGGRCNEISRFFKKVVPLLLTAILLYSYQSYAQLAPVYPPAGGFRIDGGLKANTPTANQGDWVAGPGGTGGFVLTDSGVAVVGATTGLKRDAYNSNLDFIFTTGSKFDDSIPALHWTQSTAPNKNDINNAMYHVSRDTSNNNQWIIIGGDRLSTSGTSYIDFEFLQNTLARNPSGGGFTGGGPNGGRTINDLVISMEYTNGGVAANVFFYQWKAKAGGGYEFVQFTPPAGTAFALTNGVNESVPFGAFGSTTYQPFAFVEAAINITKLLAATGDACAGLSVKTLWIKTKASASSTAALKDFVEPIPVSFTFGSASIKYAGPFCAKGTASVDLTGITGGTFSAPAGLSINASTGLIDLAASTPGTYEITYTFNSGNGCIKTAKATVVINPFPSCSITGPDGPLCPGTTGNTYTGSGGVKFKWTISGNGSIVGSDSSSSVTVTAGNNCNASFTLGLTTTNSSGCSSTCSKDVVVKDTIKPVINCPGNKQLECGAASDTSKTGKATATDNCGGTVTISYTDAATAAGCNGKAGIDRTWKAIDACGNFSTCVQHITFIDTTKPVITCPGNKQLTCGAPTDTVHTGKATATDNCGGTVIITHTDAATAASCAGIPGIDRTWRATDACGNFSTCVQHITFIDTTAPSITCPAPVTVECAGDVPTPDPKSVTTSDNCSGSVTVEFVKDEASGSCPKIITRTYKATDACGNTNTCTQTITVKDVTPPTIACVPDVKVECGDATDTTATGTPVATDNCGKPTLTHKDVNSSQNCYTLITRTWTATDGCGNTTTCVQHITVTDRTAPIVSCPSDKVLSCGESTDPSNTGTATASDNCSSAAEINIFYTDAPVAGSACPGSTNIDRTWTAIDGAGNIGTCVQHITFVQNVAPLTKVKTASVQKPVRATTQKSTTQASVNKDKKVASASKNSSGLQVTAYPNPFQKKVNFRIVSATSGKAVLEVYNISGQKLGNAFEGKLDAGVARDVQYTLPFASNSMLIYKLSVGGKSASGKIQSLE